MTIERVDEDDLTPEQKQILEGMRQVRAMEESMNRMEDAIQRAVRQQNRWIEEQIWRTDFSEVAVLDVVTYLPLNPRQEHDIKAYRYGPGDAPDDPGHYSNRSNMQTSVTRVRREEFMDLTTGEDAVEPPAFLDDVDPWDGIYGLDRDTNLDSEEGDE